MSNFVLFYVYLLLVSSIFANDTQKPLAETSANAHAPSKRMRVAILLTGQLVRLELRSKLENVIVPNLNAGHVVHLFVTLDSNVTAPKQTQFYSTYNSTPWRALRKRELRRMIKMNVKVGLEGGQRFRTFITMKGYPNKYAPINGVSRLDKMWQGKWETDQHRITPEYRFDVNMRMLTNIRDAVRHMQETELYLHRFYDLVVRVREDSYFYGPWLFKEDMLGAFTSLDVNAYGGVNDHDFVIDRKYADRFLRGLSEEYFLEFLEWGKWMKHSTEWYMRTILDTIKVRRRVTNVCELPSVPLRGMYNESHWQLHSKYAQQILLHVAKLADTPETLHSCFRPEWLTFLNMTSGPNVMEREWSMYYMQEKKRGDHGGYDKRQ